MAALGLNNGGLVQRDGRLVVVPEERYSRADLMNHDQPFFLPENRDYIMRYYIKQPIGYALLLGSSRYRSSTPLRCVEKDLQSMEEVLREGGWDVDKPCGCQMEKGGYEETVQMLREKDLKRYSCFMVYYSGHGGPEGMLLQPDCDLVPFKDVVDMVMHLDLDGKPKILIFDCCRGNDDCSDETVGGTQSNFRTLGENFAATYNDTIICFACSNNRASLSAHEDGSIFTQHFAKKLQWFGKNLSFVDLLSQAKGDTFNVAREMFKMSQQPVSYSGLNAQLLLKETILSDADREKEEVPTRSKVEKMPFRMVLVPLDNQPERKGRLTTPGSRQANKPSTVYTPLPQPRPQATSTMETHPTCEPVMKDFVSSVTRFTTRHDVINNIRTLGQGHHVFICYLPDPASPYDHPDPTRVETNLKRISRLHYDLHLHGFVVTSDLSLEDQQPLNTLEWYVRHIELCDHVILVCSPAFKELFTSSRPQRRVEDPKAQRFLCYSSAIYAECERNVTKVGRGVSKFIPVLLDPDWLDFDQSVPLLFRGSHIYQLFEEDPRKFDYDNTERHFERLVCRMVGINRATINAPQPGIPMSFSSSSSIEEVNRRKYLAQARLPRYGYVTRPSSVGQPASEESAWVQNWANVTPTEQQHTISPAVPVSAGPPQAHYATTTHPTAQQPGDTDRQRLLAHGIQHVSQSGYNTVDYYMETTAPSQTSGLPSTGECPPHTQRQYVATHYPTPSLPSSHPTLSTITSTATGTDTDPSSLPLTAPPQQLLLWLSDEVVQWKFLGRYLNVDETTIERIALENPNNIREQCFQMLKTYKSQQGEKCTCRQLGEALLESEKNRHLYSKFCAKLRELLE